MKSTEVTHAQISPAEVRRGQERNRSIFTEHLNIGKYRSYILSKTSNHVKLRHSLTRNNKSNVLYIMQNIALHEGIAESMEIHSFT
jgi:hypothetical protein